MSRSPQPAHRVLLRACAALEPEHWSGHRRDLAQMTDESWALLERLALEHGLVGLVSRSLEWAQRETKVRIPILETLAQHRRAQLVQLLRYRHAARFVTETLDRHGMQFVVYKGAVLAEEIYGDLSLRAFGDCDILVRVEAAAQVCELLQEMGYLPPPGIEVRREIARGRNSVALHHAEGYGVDLHWSIAADEVMPRDPEAVWRNCAPGVGRSLPGLRMSPELSLVNLATHFYRHGYQELKPLVDFYMTAIKSEVRIDADRVFAIARALDLAPMVDLAARLCARRLSPHPAVLRLMAGRPSLRARVACAALNEARLFRRDTGHPVTSRLRRLALCGNFTSAVRASRQTLAPRPGELEGRMGRPFRLTMYPHYYFLQAYRVATRSPRTLEDLARGLSGRSSGQGRAGSEAGPT